jgi:hypothetical protein
MYKYIYIYKDNKLHSNQSLLRYNTHVYHQSTRSMLILDTIKADSISTPETITINITQVCMHVCDRGVVLTININININIDHCLLLHACMYVSLLMLMLILHTRLLRSPLQICAPCKVRHEITSVDEDMPACLCRYIYIHIYIHVCVCVCVLGMCLCMSCVLCVCLRACMHFHSVHIQERAHTHAHTHTPIPTPVPTHIQGTAHTHI